MSKIYINIDTDEMRKNIPRFLKDGILDYINNSEEIRIEDAIYYTNVEDFLKNITKTCDKYDKRDKLMDKIIENYDSMSRNDFMSFMNDNIRGAEHET